jgi:hypothetical protein
MALYVCGLQDELVAACAAAACELHRGGVHHMQLGQVTACRAGAHVSCCTAGTVRSLLAEATTRMTAHTPSHVHPTPAPP